jgi:hypothetical protein
MILLKDSVSFKASSCRTSSYPSQSRDIPSAMQDSVSPSRVGEDPNLIRTYNLRNAHGIYQEHKNGLRIGATFLPRDPVVTAISNSNKWGRRCAYLPEKCRTEPTLPQGCSTKAVRTKPVPQSPCCIGVRPLAGLPNPAVPLRFQEPTLRRATGLAYQFRSSHSPWEQSPSSEIGIRRC